MPVPGVEVIAERCVGCGLCVRACPFGAIHVAGGIAVIDRDRCTVCGACVSACSRFKAIRGRGLPEPGAQTDTRGDIWVFCEVAADSGNTLAGVSLELLGRARALADELGVALGALMLGTRLDAPAASAIAHGADHVYTVCHPDLVHYDDERYAAVVAQLVTEYAPAILLGGATAVGRALLPRVAVQVRTGLTADCTELAVDPDTGLLQQTRPAFGGNILATILCERHRPQMATVRPGVLPRLEPDPTRVGEIVCCPVSAAQLRSGVQWLGFRPRQGRDRGLREAGIIVAAGYGTGGPEGVALVAQLAAALGGALGASRSVVDAGWLDYSHQVGQTGTTVQPQLYVACGISGAIQHLVGMQNSETVVALNRDPEAPIFAHADYAFVGDLQDVIPAILQQLQTVAIGP